MNMFISPPEETDWKIEVDELTSKITAQFEQSLVTRTARGAHSLEWVLDSGLEGSLDRAGNTVVLDADIEDCARFAVWFRELVPQSQSLLFYDESFSADVRLEMVTTVEELIAPFVLDGDS